jgi:hypothetical protein
MGVRRISTGKYIEDGQVVECVCIPLLDQSLSSIAIKENRIFVNYEKLFYNEEDEIIIDETQKFAFQLSTQEELDNFLETQLMNGSSIADDLEERIVDKIKEQQKIQ